MHGFTGALSGLESQPLEARLRSLLLETRWGACPAPVALEQAHTANIRDFSPVARPSDSAQTPGDPLWHKPADGYDGAMAAWWQPILLTIRTADCVPVLAADPEVQRVAALHVGWRGASQAILPRLLEAWRGLGSSLRALRLVFGPSIRACCYQVREDCLQAFDPAHLRGAVRAEGGAWHLDLTAVLMRQVEPWGIGAGQVETLPYCTCCHRDELGHHPFASYRRELKHGILTTDRNASFIGWGPGVAGSSGPLA